MSPVHSALITFQIRCLLSKHLRDMLCVRRLYKMPSRLGTVSGALQPTASPSIICGYQFRYYRFWKKESRR